MNNQKTLIWLAYTSLIALAIPVGASIHEGINYAIFRSYGVSSQIHFGVITFTQPNSAQFYSLSPVSQASLEQKISVNEAGLMNALPEILVIALVSLSITRRKI